MGSVGYFGIEDRTTSRQ